jgi:hypothetical protein
MRGSVTMVNRCLVLSLALAACSSSGSSGTDASGGGTIDAAASPDSGGAGGGLTGGSSGSQGNSDGAAGTGGVAASDGGLANADAATADGPGNGGMGDGGGSMLPAELPNIPGPTTDQKPIVVPFGQDTIPQAEGYGISSAAVDSKHNLVLAVGDTGGSYFGILKLDPTFKNTTWAIFGGRCPAALTGCKVSPALLQGFNRGLAVATDDFVYAGNGLGSTDMGAVASRFDPATGDLVWTKGVPAVPGVKTINTGYIAAGPNGSVYAFGRFRGQAPGNPPDNTNGMIVARYEADGTRTFVTQTPLSDERDLLMPGFLVDDAGNAFYAVSDSTMAPNYAFVLRRVSPTGKLANSTIITRLYYGVHVMRFAKDQKSIYLVKSTKNAAQQSNFLLFNIGLDGSLNWYRELRVHTETLDPVEGVTWTGMGGVSDLVATGDSVYLVGRFQNHYMNGSRPRPDTTPGFVTRLDLSGNQIWFQEIQFDSDTSPVNPTSFGPLFVGADDNPFVFSNADHPGAAASRPLYLVKLKKEDGTRLSW